MTDYDSPWKEALDVYFEPFMAFFFPHAYHEIDWARGYEALDKELRQVVREAEVGSRVVDKLVKVWRTNGEEEWVLIHVEVQSQEEADFGRRMYVYNYRLFDRYNRSVASLAVLGDDRPGWRPEGFGYTLWGCSVGFRFPVVKLLDYAGRVAALEADANPFAAVVLAHLKTQETRQDPEARRFWKVRLVKGLYERGLDSGDIRQLFRFIDWMMNLPEPMEQQFQQELFRFEEEKRMAYVTSIERMGQEKGRQEGLQEGRRQGLLTGIQVSLEQKFGPEGLQLLPEIRGLKDMELFQAVHRAIWTATTVDEVRRVYAGPTAAGQNPAQKPES